MKRLAMLAIATVTAALTLALYPSAAPQPAQGMTPSHYIIAVADQLKQADRPRCMMCEYILLVLCHLNPIWCTK